MAKIFIVTLALIAVANSAVIYPAAVSYQNTNLRGFAYPSQQYLATGIIAATNGQYSTQQQQQQYYNQQNPGHYVQRSQYHGNQAHQHANYAQPINSAAYTNAEDFTTSNNDNTNNYRTNYGNNYNNEQRRY